MSTHVWYCAWCGKQTGCPDETHVLGSGQDCCDIKFEGEDGFPKVRYGQSHPVEFCSLQCFQALLGRMGERLRIAKEWYPEWFNEQ